MKRSSVEVALVGCNVTLTEPPLVIAIPWLPK